MGANGVKINILFNLELNFPFYIVNVNYSHFWRQFLSPLNLATLTSFHWVLYLFCHFQMDIILPNSFKSSKSCILSRILCLNPKSRLKKISELLLNKNQQMYLGVSPASNFHNSPTPTSLKVFRASIYYLH